MNALKKLYRILEGFEKAFFCATFLFLSFAIVAEVLMRKFTANGFPWLEELCRYSFIVATFIGGSIAVTSDEHPRMTAVYSLVGPKAKLILSMICDAVCAVFFVYMTFFGIEQTVNSYQMGTLTSTIQLPLFIFFAVLPLSFVGMVVRYCFRIAGSVKKLKGGTDE